MFGKKYTGKDKNLILKVLSKLVYIYNYKWLVINEGNFS